MNNGGGGVAALTELLAELKAAQDAREDFLEEAYESNKFVKAAADADATAAGRTEANADDIDGAIGTEYSSAADTLGQTLGFTAGNFETRTASVQDAAIQEGVEAAEKDISDLQAEIAKVDGLGLAIRNYNNAVDAAEEALEERNVVRAETAGSVAAFNTRSNDFSAVALDGGTISGDVSGATAVTATFRAGETDEETGVEIMTVTNGQFVIASEYSDVAGIVNLRDALQAEFDAYAAWAKADARETSTLNVLNTEFGDLQGEDADLGADGTTDGKDVADALAGLEQALSDLNDEIVRFEAARELRDELKVLNDNAEDALEAIEDAEDGLGVDVWTAADATAASEIDVDSATDDVADDVILFSKELDGFTIENFGNVGEDRLFFGEGYSLVQLDEAWDETEATGDASALEIFWSQGGGNLTLYVETEAFGGSASGASDIAEITLTGVTAADIDFANGYLTAGEPA